MREILFRGKRVDNGEWVEGFVVKRVHNEGEFLDGKIKWGMIKADYIFPEIEDSCYKTIPETLCEFTGLCDKNGKRIFEGDIVRSEKNYCDGVVCFDRIGNDGGIGLNGYFIKERDAFGEFEEQETDYDTKEKFYECNRCIDLKRLEVIGNIHDNGELPTAERSDNENQ